MKKVRTLVKFREKDNYAVVHEVGDIFECTSERAEYLISLGFVEAVKPAASKPAAVEEKVDEKPKTEGYGLAKKGKVKSVKE